jgi:hypothetical protein
MTVAVVTFPVPVRFPRDAAYVFPFDHHIILAVTVTEEPPHPSGFSRGRDGDDARDGGLLNFSNVGAEPVSNWYLRK